MTILRTIRKARDAAIRDAGRTITFTPAAFAGLIDALSVHRGGPRQWVEDESRTNEFCAMAQAYFDLEQESA